MGKWEIYYDNTWYIDIIMMVTPCQDICISGNSNYQINFNKAVFVYLYFDVEERSNIYLTNGEITGYRYIYLMGWHDDQKWQIFDGAGALYADCSIVNNIGNDYIFNIDDCSNVGSWKNSLSYVNDTDMTAYKCMAKTVENCIKLEVNSEIYRSYLINEPYQNLAVGFDLNTALYVYVISVFIYKHMFL